MRAAGSANLTSGPEACSLHLFLGGRRVCPLGLEHLADHQRGCYCPVLLCLCPSVSPDQQAGLHLSTGPPPVPSSRAKDDAFSVNLGSGSACSLSSGFAPGLDVLLICVCHCVCVTLARGWGLSARPRAPLPAEDRVGLTPVLASGSPRGVTGAASRSGRPGLFCTRSSHSAGPLAGTQPSGTLPPGGPGKIPGLGLRAPGPGGTSSYMAPQGGLLPAGAGRWASKTVTVRVLACGRAGLRHRAPRHRAPRHRGLNGKETASSPEGNLSLCGARGSGHQSEDLSLVPSHHTPTH